METFPFKKVIIAIIVIMVIVAGVGLYLGADESAPPITTTTPTPTPTLTLILTPTPSGEQVYAITIATHINILNQALSSLSVLMAIPQIGNTNWTSSVAVQLATIQSLYNEAIEIDPPSSMAYIHDKYVEAMEHYNTATQLITQGIDEVNVNLIEEQAIVEMNTGSQLLNEAIELLNDFT